MKKSAQALFLFLVLLIMASLVFWAYDHRDSSKPDYSRAFKHVDRGNRKTEKQNSGEATKEYHGTKEKDIRKWKGKRYSTY